MFFGREWYMDDLKSLWRKRTSSLVACRGRRRVGKSTLFREFAKRTAQVYLEFEGLAPRKCSTNQGQINAFLMALASQTGKAYRPTDNWYDVFHQLDERIDDRKKIAFGTTTRDSTCAMSSRIARRSRPGRSGSRPLHSSRAGIRCWACSSRT